MLSVNARSLRASALVSSTLGHGSDDDPPKDKDSDSFNFRGKSGEKVAIVGSWR